MSQFRIRESTGFLFNAIHCVKKLSNALHVSGLKPRLCGYSEIQTIYPFTQKPTLYTIGAVYGRSYSNTFINYIEISYLVTFFKCSFCYLI